MELAGFSLLGDNCWIMNVVLELKVLIGSEIWRISSLHLL